MQYWTQYWNPLLNQILNPILNPNIEPYIESQYYIQYCTPIFNSIYEPIEMTIEYNIQSNIETQYWTNYLTEYWNHVFFSLRIPAGIRSLWNNFLWENLCFFKTTHNWQIKNILHIDFKSVFRKYFVKIHKLSLIIKVLVNISCWFLRFPAGNTCTPTGKKHPDWNSILKPNIETQ